jgi:hypothetical protein
MDGRHEIQELLREIRDLQRAHFERYQAFTEGILAAEKAAAERAEHIRHEQERYQDEMRQAALRNQRSAWIRNLILIVVLAVGVASVQVVGMFLSILSFW